MMLLAQKYTPSRGACIFLVTVVFLAQMLNGLAVVPEAVRPWLKIFPIGFVVLAIPILFSARPPYGLPALHRELSITFGQFAASMLIGTVVILACLFIDSRAGRLVPITLPFDTYRTWTELEDSRSYAPLGVFGTWVALALLAALVEEPTYKALLIRCFAKQPSKIAFVCISSGLFGAMHIEYGLIWTILMTLVYGVPSAIYYYETRNLGVLLVMHITMAAVSSSYVFI